MLYCWQPDSRTDWLTDVLIPVHSTVFPFQTSVAATAAATPVRVCAYVSVGGWEGSGVTEDIIFTKKEHKEAQ